MKIRTLNKYRRISELPYKETINYVVNEEEAIITVDPLTDNLNITINTNFSFFGDVVKFHLQSSNPLENRRVRFMEGILSPDISIGKSCFIEFQFDGNNYLPIGGGGAASDLRIGSIINDSTIGALMYTDKSNLIKQDPNYLYYNDKKKFLGVGHDNPATNIDIVGPRKQIKISSNSPKQSEATIEFGVYGSESRWIIGGFGDNLEDFCLKDLKTGDIYKLNLVKISITDLEDIVKETPIKKKK
jgi:hypothetical protein